MENLLVENYLSGRLPLPDPILQAILNLSVESYYRFGKRLEEVPSQWDGEQGEIVPGNASALMQVHYDLPAAIFEQFLGRTMKYSMALWETGARDLDSAQDAMMADLCKKMDMRDGLTVLDIGCGFGSFAAYLLKHYPNCRVTGLTLSKAQYGYMMDKHKEPGHVLNTDRFNAIRQDFNEVDFPERFDRVVSIGVFEHVSNIKLALRKLRKFLKDDGACLLHYIVYRRIIERFVRFDMQDTFMCRYIFPDSRFWHELELLKFQDDLKVEEHWFLNGRNYQRTLQEWLNNFRDNWEKIRAVRGDGDQFFRIWNYYFRFTQALFRGQGGTQVGNAQYLLRPVRAD